MDINDIGDLPVFFTTDGKDIWTLESYFNEPSCTLKNLRTGALDEFGLSSLAALSYRKIKMPKKGLEALSNPHESLWDNADFRAYMQNRNSFTYELEV